METSDNATYKALGKPLGTECTLRLLAASVPSGGGAKSIVADARQPMRASPVGHRWQSTAYLTVVGNNSVTLSSWPKVHLRGRRRTTSRRVTWKSLIGFRTEWA